VKLYNRRYSETNRKQFITDASIHPDLATGNIQTIVMVAAEAAVAKILAN
jgi:choline dehydrogenase-like flavoprotein